MKTRFLLSVFLLVFYASYGQEYPVDKGAFIFSGMGSFMSQGGDLFEGEDNSKLKRYLCPHHSIILLRRIFLLAGDLNC